MASKTCSGKFFGILAVLLIVCLAQCAAGSCLSYGHSCWGGHGKRSALPGQNLGPLQARLLVSKLIRQNIRRNNIIPFPGSEDFLRSQRFMRNPFESRDEKGKFLQVNSPIEVEDEAIPEQKQESDQIAYIDEPYKVNFMEFMKNNAARQ